MTRAIASEELQFVFFYYIKNWTKHTDNNDTATQRRHLIVLIFAFNILTFCMPTEHRLRVRRSVALQTPYNDTIHWRSPVDEELRQFLSYTDDFI